MAPLAAASLTATHYGCKRSSVPPRRVKGGECGVLKPLLLQTAGIIREAVLAC